MFENRSFDNMLGGLYPKKSHDDYHGLNPDPKAFFNPADPYLMNSPTIAVWQGATGLDTMTMPYPDPGELFKDMNQQIFGANPDTGPPTMDGFVFNYQNQPGNRGVNPAGWHIMQYYAPGADGNIPITSTLAQNYAVCDEWYGSGPTQTFPNRVFAICGFPGTCKENGATRFCVNDTDYLGTLGLDLLGHVKNTSIFEVLDNAGLSWNIYYGQKDRTLLLFDERIALSRLVDYVEENQQNLVLYDGEDDGFDAKCRRGTLPTYSFIEPRYFTSSDYGIANSNHPGGSKVDSFDPAGQSKPPPISVCDGEELLRSVYTSLASNPSLFQKTLLIVTYDEHGGLYDHMCPPAAVSPILPGQTIEGFSFDRYGPRVPTLFINPYIQPGTVWRPPQSSSHPFDHTSVISTLFAQFELTNGSQTWLTPRDQCAPTLEGLIGSDQPLNPFDASQLPALDCPIPVDPHPSVSTVAVAADTEPSGAVSVFRGALKAKNQKE